MIIIGLAGPSCSGKTSLAYLLARHFRTEHLSCDEFYIKGGEKIYIDYKGERVRTFERPALYDGARLARVLHELQDSGVAIYTVLNLDTNQQEQRTTIAKDVMIVEGFLLYQYPELRRTITHKFFVDINEDEIIRRRTARDSHHKSNDAFLKVGIDEYRQYGWPQREFEDVYVLDGRKSLEELKDKVLEIVGK